eukprot:129012-Chlamydomonas_euryale.AAC.2
MYAPAGVAWPAALQGSGLARDSRDGAFVRSRGCVWRKICDNADGARSVFCGGLRRGWSAGRASHRTARTKMRLGAVGAVGVATHTVGPDPRARCSRLPVWRASALCSWIHPIIGGCFDMKTPWCSRLLCLSTVAVTA